MKKLFYVIVFCCCVLPNTTRAEKIDTIAKTDSAFFRAIYQKDIFYADDSISIISEHRKLVLLVDATLNSKDSIGLILEDTSLFQLGLQCDTLIFFLNNVNVIYWDTIDSPFIAIQYIPNENNDTLLYRLQLSKIENKSYAIKPTIIQTLLSQESMWWTIGGIVLLFLLIIGCAIFTFCMRHKKERKPEQKRVDDSAVDSANDSTIDGTGDSDHTISGDSTVDNTDGTVTRDSHPEFEKTKEISRLKAIIHQYESERSTLKSKIEAEAKEMLDAAQRKWNIEKENIKKEEKDNLAIKDNEIAKIKGDYLGRLNTKETELKVLKEELKAEMNKAKSIREEVIAEKKKEIEGINEKLNTANKNLQIAKADIAATKTKLENAEKNLSNANSQIRYLQESQQQYAEKIALVPYAESYSKLIKKLFDVEHSINEGVIRLSQKGLEDPYHLFKATYRFKAGCAEIDMEKFLVEVEMAANKQMTFTGNGIAHLATLKGDELAKQVRMYFVLNYLSKYIGALQIYNESLIGLEKLMEDVNASDVAQFLQARKQLESLYEAMQIKVICPHLFDSIGNNMDLRVEQVDAGFDSGDILEIMNCLVYAVDGQKPTDKIFVKAQQ